MEKATQPAEAIRNFGNALADLRNEVAQALALERLDARLARQRALLSDDALRAAAVSRPEGEQR